MVDITERATRVRRARRMVEGGLLLIALSIAIDVFLNMWVVAAIQSVVWLMCCLAYYWCRNQERLLALTMEGGEG